MSSLTQDGLHAGGGRLPEVGPEELPGAEDGHHEGPEDPGE